MKKKLVSIILALVLSCTYALSVSAAIDFRAIDPNKEGNAIEKIEEYIANATIDEMADTVCETQICTIDGKEMMSFSRVHHSYQESKGDGENTFDCIIGGKAVLLQDIKEMSVYYSDMTQFDDGRPVGCYVAPDDFDKSYETQYIQNIPAGTTFTFDKYGHYEFVIIQNGRSGKYTYMTARLEDEEFDRHILSSKFPQVVYKEYEAYLNGEMADALPPETNTPAKPIYATSKAQEVMIGEFAGPYEAYNIYDNNYFKLRDICGELSFIGYEIDVTWDAEKGAINLITGQAYTPVGGENRQSDGLTREAVLSNAKVYLNGEPIQITAYNIEGNNFFKLRDLCKVLNIYIEWDSQLNLICVDPDRTYIDN